MDRNGWNDPIRCRDVPVGFFKQCDGLDGVFNRDGPTGSVYRFTTSILYPAMIFTTGNKLEWDARLIEAVGKRTIFKLGRCPSYVGGRVWRTLEEALANCKPGEDVYGVQADWTEHTVPSADGPWHDLIFSVPMVRLTVRAEYLAAVKCSLSIGWSPLSLGSSEQITRIENAILTNRQ